MKIAAVVILYNPTGDIVPNILSYYPFVDLLFILDNSLKDFGVEKPFFYNKNVEYLQDYQNKGIAVRLNYACEKAKEMGYDWMLTAEECPKNVMAINTPKPTL